MQLLVLFLIGLTVDMLVYFRQNRRTPEKEAGPDASGGPPTPQACSSACPRPDCPLRRR